MARRVVIFFLIVLTGSVSWAVFTPRPVTPRLETTRWERPPYDPSLIDKNVAFYAAGAKSSSQNAIGYALLASCYLQRCRETGDIGDAVRAEQAARHSLAIRTRYNESAFHALALSLFTQHRFPEARNLAERVWRSNPSNMQAYALRIEIDTESGNYEAAEGALRRYEVTPQDRQETLLHARLLEINGQPERALALLQAARRAAESDVDMPRENVAWFHDRVGDLYAVQGKTSEAERSYREALELFPRDYRALTGLTRLAAGRREWSSALTWGQKAADIVPTPEIVALIGDAYTGMGRKKEAEQQYALVETIAKLAQAQGSIYDRQYALFCADHDRHLNEALTLARRELTIRQDVYAWDTLAWACYKKGQLKAAAEASRKALSRNTQEGRLFYHAGRIAEAQGDHAQARDYLQTALKINPFFAPFAPQQAQDLLTHLRN